MQTFFAVQEKNTVWENAQMQFIRTKEPITTSFFLEKKSVGNPGKREQGATATS